MLTAWDAVSTLDRMLDDVMGSTFGTATNPQASTRPSPCRTASTTPTWMLISRTPTTEGPGDNFGKYIDRCLRISFGEAQGV
jgi:hypothetical protein